MSNLNNNTLQLEALLAKVNALPEAGGVDLPALTNEGVAEDLMLNKELIDSDGNKITGTFTIDNELTEQNDLISQISTLVATKANTQGGSVETCTVIIHADADAKLTRIAYSYVEADGKVATYYNDDLGNISNTTLTLENIICGSYMFIDWMGISPYASCTNAISLDGVGWNWKIPTIRGCTEIITLYGDG